MNVHVRYALAGLAVLALLPLGLTSYQTEVTAQILIYAIFAMSLDLLVGYTGMPSLGHSAYFGFGAYVAALATLKAGAPWWLAVLAALVATILIAAAFNLLALRTARAYYLMITLGLSQVLWSLAVSWTDVTGGDNGLPGIARPLGLADTREYYYFVLAVCAAAAGAMLLVVSSPFGHALKGIRENEERMRALGYDTWRYKFVVSLLSAFFAGVAGILFMYLNNFVSPATLTVALSAQVLLMVLIGAPGRLAGSFLGAAVVVILQYSVSTYTQRWLFVVGAIYVAIALFAPQGALAAIGAWFARRKGAP